MIPLSWSVLARAEVTKRLAHGDRYLETRLFLADGRVMEQVNPGVADLENDWREIGRYTDLDRALHEMKRSGWRIRREGDGGMRLPVLRSTTPIRAWTTGLLLAAAAWLLLFVPFGGGLFLLPLSFGGLVVYALGVRPRAFAASGVLLGTAPFLAWGVIDGLQKCARFNRAPGGGCETDPTAQVVIAVAVYALAVVVTALATRTAWTR